MFAGLDQGMKPRAHWQRYFEPADLVEAAKPHPVDKQMNEFEPAAQEMEARLLPEA